MGGASKEALREKNKYLGSVQNEGGGGEGEGPSVLQSQEQDTKSTIEEGI